MFSYAPIKRRISQIVFCMMIMLCVSYSRAYAGPQPESYNYDPQTISSIDEYLDSASKFIDNNDCVSANPFIDKILEMDQHSYRGHFYRGWCLSADQKDDEAINAYRASIEASPSEGYHSYKYIALIYMKKDNNVKAKENFQNFLNYVKDDGEIYYALALINFKQQNYTASLKNLEKANTLTYPDELDLRNQIRWKAPTSGDIVVFYGGILVILFSIGVLTLSVIGLTKRLDPRFMIRMAGIIVGVTTIVSLIIAMSEMGRSGSGWDSVIRLISAGIGLWICMGVFNLDRNIRFWAIFLSAATVGLHLVGFSADPAWMVGFGSNLIMNGFIIGVLLDADVIDVFEKGMWA